MVYEEDIFDVEEEEDDILGDDEDDDLYSDIILYREDGCVTDAQGNVLIRT